MQRHGERLAYLDHLRGLALLLIVMDHAADAITHAFGLDGAGGVGVPWYKTFDAATNATRIPVLMFMTALFLERSMAKAGEFNFLLGRARYLAWPLLLWSTLQVVVLAPILPPPDAASIDSLRQLLSYVWRLSMQFWFLHVLLVFSLLFLVLRRFNRMIVLAGAVIVFAASIALEAMQVGGFAATTVIVFGRQFLFFWLGYVLSEWIVKRDAELPIAAKTAIVSLFALTVAWPLRDLHSWSPIQIMALSGLPAIPVMIWLGRTLPYTPFAATLQWIGENSLVVFCVHFMLAVLSAHLLVSTGISNPTFLLFTVTAGAIAGCWAIERTLRRFGLSAYAGFKSRA